jgi:hypothetical protein
MTARRVLFAACLLLLLALLAWQASAVVWTPPSYHGLWW